jgi:hypothetical protein
MTQTIAVTVAALATDTVNTLRIRCGHVARHAERYGRSDENCVVVDGSALTPFYRALPNGERAFEQGTAFFDEWVVAVCAGVDLIVEPCDDPWEGLGEHFWAFRWEGPRLVAVHPDDDERA